MSRDTEPKNPQAFPSEYPYEAQRGMTLRDYFAGQALPAVIKKLNFVGLYHEEHSGDSTAVARACYKIADAMLEARNQ